MILTTALTTEQVETYRHNRGQKCPLCGGQMAANQHGMEADGDQGWWDVRCTKCGKEFVEEWKMANIEIAEDSEVGQG